MRRRPVRVMLVVLCALAGLAVTAAAVGLLVVNMRVLPGLLMRAQTAAAAAGAEVEVGSVRYTPWSGIVARDIHIHTDEQMVTADVVRLRISMGGALQARRLAANPIALQIPDPRSPGAVEQLWHLAGIAGELAAPLGRIEVLAADLTLGAVAVRQATVVHEPQTGGVTFDAVLATETTLSGEISYRHREAELSFDAPLPDGVPQEQGTAAVVAGSVSGQITVTTGEPETVTQIEGLIGLHGFRALVPVVATQEIGPVDLDYVFTAELDPAIEPPDLAALEPLSRAAELTHTQDLIRTAHKNALPAFGALTITSGDMTINGVRADVLPTLWGIYQPTEAGGPLRLDTPRWVAVTACIPTTPAQTILDAIPQAIAGPLADAKLDGTLAVDGEFRLPFRVIEAMDWVADTELDGFAVRRIPTTMNPYALNDAFVHTIVDDEQGYRRTVQIPAARPASMTWMLTHSEHRPLGIERMRREADERSADPPEVLGERSVGVTPDPTYRYVYLDEMSRWVPAAILTAEDGDFFFYGGVNPVTLKGAIARNIHAGEILYGASTISMQVAKLVFLDQQRVFARKLQEVFLVYLMEHHVVVPKDRILELYINLAEFGPGVFGINHAARYYFDKDPSTLTAGEAVWLASILPAPKVYHEYFEAGSISDGWWIRMTSYLDIMLERERMTSAEYEAATSRRPTFAGGG